MDRLPLQHVRAVLCFRRGSGQGTEISGALPKPRRLVVIPEKGSVLLKDARRPLITFRFPFLPAVCRFRGQIERGGFRHGAWPVR